MTPLWLRVLRFPLIRLALLGGAMVMLIGVSQGLQQQWAATPLRALAIVAALVVAALALHVGFAWLVEGRAARELALPGMGRELAAGLLVGAALYTSCVLLLMAVGAYRIEGLNPWHVMLPAMAMALSSGVLEELLFRGALFRIVEESLGSWVALVVSALLFGLVHLMNPAATLTGALFISVEAGLLLAAAFMLTRRLWLGIGFHVAWNYTQSAVFSGVVSGNEAAVGLIQARIAGPDWLTGGSFGLEASVPAFVVCTMAGVVMLVMAVRRGRVVAPFWRR